jgi:hypothetical protein
LLTGWEADFYADLIARRKRHPFRPLSEQQRAKLGEINHKVIGLARQGGAANA